MYTRKSTSKSSHVYCGTSVSLENAGKAALLAVRHDNSVARREAAIQASCLLLLRHGMRGYCSTPLVNGLLPAGTRAFRTYHELWRTTGGQKTLIERLTAGKALPEGSLGEWTPDFIYGLARSGALRRTKHMSFWFTAPLNDRPALRGAIKGGLPFHCTWAEQDLKGQIFMSLCGVWAFIMGADDPEGIGVLAGVLAGGKRMIHDGQSWLWLRGDGLVGGHSAALLASYGIPFVRVVTGTPKQEGILVSPFWGALLAYEMPVCFRQWFEGWRGGNMPRGMCPLLPWAFLRAAWGERACTGFPKEAVPFLVDRHFLFRNSGIGMKQVKEQAFRRFGFYRVDPRLRAAWLKRMALEGIKESDFDFGKVPLDFHEQLCHDGCNEREEHHEERLFI